MPWLTLRPNVPLPRTRHQAPGTCVASVPLTKPPRVQGTGLQPQRWSPGLIVTQQCASPRSVPPATAMADKVRLAVAQRSKSDWPVARLRQNFICLSFGIYFWNNNNQGEDNHRTIGRSSKGLV
ncbi:hypothetical protein BO70DRAFT_15464 [Aspergillus heteromorphus CBS 117.55]|uniref:Uncharacterized protein n=1 Tax=Aspergillus heteromorphus CBS 117.55 TaxID=1448321 RepID=A0A317X243_9EURO|nr:uncharacterized protein BO70DRAFT_15464 [Aspergillus heteromorphus CBS 117.55]PWY92636.1 hypothetical protein BO70DRAFT_15464 [Aspergillus heteromorphus CBS 117.55]